MSTYDEMCANRHQRRIEIAARRLPQFFEQVDSLVKEEERVQRRIERFATVTQLINDRHEIALLPMPHRLEIDESDEQRKVPALNVCAIVGQRWTIQYFLVKDPRFLPTRRHLYMTVRGASEMRVFPYGPSNSIAGNHHPGLIAQALTDLCDAVSASGQTNVPTAYA